MNWWSKIKKGINPDEEEQFTDVFEDDEIYGVFGGAENTAAGDFTGSGAYQAYPPSAVQSSSSITVSVTGDRRPELKAVKPEDYNNPHEIADYLLDGKTVILNLEETGNETARRLLAFLRGLAYAVGGRVEKVSSRTFAVTPANVIISSERLKNARAGDSVNPERSSKSTV